MQYNAVYIPLELCFSEQFPAPKHPVHIALDFFGALPEPEHSLCAPTLPLVLQSRFSLPLRHRHQLPNGILQRGL